MARLLIFLAWILAGANSFGAELLRVATFNLENYVDAATESRPAKSEESKAKIRETILAMKPDVLALEEMGNTNALLELRGALQRRGLSFPFWEMVSGYDTNIHVAVLSRFPFTRRTPHVRETFLLRGRRFRLTRGFAELEIEANPNYRFTVIAAHLKSRRTSAEVDETELRQEEARLLRELVDARLKENPELNLVVLGDFNDVKDSRAIRLIAGRGKSALIDTRPAERNGDQAIYSGSHSSARKITWTHYYGKDDTYSRIDYIFISSGMSREWVPEESYVFAQPDWGLASDHRPVLAAFQPADR